MANTFKVTMLFRQSSGQGRTGGWSESYVTVADGFEAAFTASNDLVFQRARMMPTGSRIIGRRISNLDSPGQSQSYPTNSVGTGHTLQDVPQAALLCFARTATGNERQLIFRGIPDARIVEGEYEPTVDYQSAITGFFTVLRNGWGFMGRDETKPLVDVKSVSTLGVFELYQDLTFAVGNQLKFYRTFDNFNRPVKGLQKVGARVDAKNGTIQNWSFGSVNKGRVRLQSVIYQAISGCRVSRVIVRKVGRDFFQYSGRQSR